MSHSCAFPLETINVNIAAFLSKPLTNPQVLHTHRADSYVG